MIERNTYAKMAMKKGTSVTTFLIFGGGMLSVLNFLGGRRGLIRIFEAIARANMINP